MYLAHFFLYSFFETSKNKNGLTMEKRTDKNLYTMLFAIGMVIVVGSLLAFVASSLRPKIDENKRISGDTEGRPSRKKWCY